MSSDPSPSSSQGLLRVLGLVTGLAVTFGGIVSLGILRAPGEIAEQLPDPWWYMSVWIIAGLFALLGTASAAEMATSLPRAGAYYAYAHRAFGPFVGFVSGWTDWLNWCGATAVTIIVIIEYLHLLTPAVSSENIPLAAAIAVAFALVQWRGVRWGSGVHNVTSIIKSLIFAALIITCFIIGGGAAMPEAAAETPQMPGGWTLIMAFVVALRGVIYAYDGWVFTAYFSEEMKDPGRMIPRAMFGGVWIVITVYLLINIAVLRMLPMSEIAGAELAVGKAIESVFGAMAETFITAMLTGFMLIGLNLGYMLASRVVYAMSCDGLFFANCKTVNKGGTPTIALAASVAATLVFLFFSSTFAKLMEVLAIFTVVNYVILFLAVFTMRRREPDLPRPYKAWGHPWSTGIALVGGIAFLVGTIISGTTTVIYALVLVAVSSPVYVLFRRVKRRTGK